MNTAIKSKHIIYSLFFLICIITFTHCSGNIESQLKAIAKETNTECPKMLDNWTRLDKCAATGGANFEYHLTILQIAITDTTNFKSQLKPQLLQVLKTNPSLKIFRDNDVTIKYIYNDKDGKYIFSETIIPQEYKQ